MIAPMESIKLCLQLGYSHNARTTVSFTLKMHSILVSVLNFEMWSCQVRFDCWPKSSTTHSSCVIYFS